MHQPFLLFWGSFTWSAQWIAAVAAIATATASVAGVALKARRKGKKLRQTGTSSEVGAVNSNVAAIGNNITQHITYEHHSIAHVAQSHDRIPSSPSFCDIEKALESATPYNRHYLADNYKGIPLNWLVEFISVSKESKMLGGRGKLDVQFRTILLDDVQGKYDLHRGYISGSVRTEDYPYLKIAQEGQRCWIQGHIQKIEYGIVWLKDGFHIWFD